MVKNKSSAIKNLEIGTLIENFDEKLTFIAEKVSSIQDVQNEHTAVLAYHTEKLEKLDLQMQYVMDKKADKEEVKNINRKISILENKI